VQRLSRAGLTNAQLDGPATLQLKSQVQQLASELSKLCSDLKPLAAGCRKSQLQLLYLGAAAKAQSVLLYSLLPTLSACFLPD
jgi:aspartate ammonia-lyase